MKTPILKKFSERINFFERNDIITYREAAPIVTPFEIGSALTEYYSHLQFSKMPTIGNAQHLMLFSLDNLESAQSGWFWIRDKKGNVVENSNWKRSWVVFALRDGDAVFVDAESDNGKVFGSIQQRNFFISDSLENFLATYLECIDIEEEFHREVMDDDFNYLGDYLKKVGAVAENHLGSEGCSGYMKLFFG